MATPHRWSGLLTPLQVVLTLGLFAECALLLGLAAWPGVALWLAVAARLEPASPWRLPALCVAGAAGYFVSGLALLVIVPAARWLTFAGGTPVGRFPYLSLGAWRWASYNALTLLVRFTFVNWIRLTPFLPLYHRLMGARIGARVQINTAVIADQNLITIGDDTVIGGDVTLVAHSAERGRLVAAPVVIGRQVTVGLMAVIMPGCTIGDGAVIAAGAVLSKHARVGPGEVWAGVPARRVGRLRRPGATSRPPPGSRP
jgi:non-ribosomal peptide synthetase-like protein